MRTRFYELCDVADGCRGVIEGSQPVLCAFEWGVSVGASVVVWTEILGPSEWIPV